MTRALTQLAIGGLVRDSSGLLVAGSGALRQAANVVVRAPGVAESRPNFQILVSDSIDEEIRALHEFDSHILVSSYDASGGAYHVRNDYEEEFTEPVAGAFTPVDFGAASTQFATSRMNLYATGAKGLVAFESGSPTTADARMAGVEITFATDYAFPGVSAYTGLNAGAVWSWAYKFVYVKKDSHGYTRRSPPSYRHFCFARDTPNPDVIGVYASGTKFFFPLPNDFGAPEAGDQVEFYRTRVVAGLSPGPDHYLALTYTITATDITNTYFVPPTDTTKDADLGAALYANPEQEGAAQAKYVPPLSQALSYWQRVMWYGNTAAKQRATVALNRLHRAGVMRFTQWVQYTIGSLIVTCSDTTGLVPGMYWTDQFKYGPSVAGTYVPANTYILSVDSPTQITISNNALATTPGPNVVFSGVMDLATPQGLIAEKSGSGTYTTGSKVVTGLTSTAGWRAGMYWTDSATGPEHNGTRVQARTKIESVDSATQITMTRVALSTGTADAYVGDVFTVDRDYFAWFDYGSGVTVERIWTDGRDYCFPILDASFGDYCFQLAVSVLAQWICFYRMFSGVTGVPGSTITAIPNGDIGVSSILGTSYVVGYAPLYQIDNPATGFTLEESGVGGSGFTVSSSCPTAWTPDLTTPLASENDARPNRLYFSQMDEPEAVSLLSYIDVGDQRSPILALTPLRNALLVLKADGLWRVTGSAPTAWSVDLLDPTLRLVRPEAVDVAKNVAYCWGDRGFFAVTEEGAVSLTAAKLDQELRPYLAIVRNDASTHGAFVVAWPARQLVLFGVPEKEGGLYTSRLYCFSLVTEAWSEWPLSWGPVAGSSADNLYYSRRRSAAVLYEVRSARESVTGYDAVYTYTAGTVTVITFGGVTTATIAVANLNGWDPQPGDMLRRWTFEGFQFRRITAVDASGDPVVLTLESAFPPTSGESILGWAGVEMASCVITIEWPPAAPAGIPIGSIAREIQVQMDLRSGPDDSTESSIPSYEIGGTSDLVDQPYTLVSHKPRVNQIQPIRVGVSRQVARGANLAPILITSDIFAMRVNGISIVFEGTSERTRR